MNAKLNESISDLFKDIDLGDTPVIMGKSMFIEYIKKLNGVEKLTFQMIWYFMHTGKPLWAK